MFSYLLLFQSCIPHLYLHSFPTRRSSDLLARRDPVSGCVRAAADDARDGQAPGHRGVRSEEHTSELQSHSDLVCRLLLEKKKITSFSRSRSKTSSRCWLVP